MSWDVTRRQVRNLETRLDASLNQYSRLAVNITRADQGASAWPGTDVEEGRKGMSSSGREDAMEKENAILGEEIERLLSEVSGSYVSMELYLTESYHQLDVVFP